MYGHGVTVVIVSCSMVKCGVPSMKMPAAHGMLSWLIENDELRTVAKLDLTVNTPKPLPLKSVSLTVKGRNPTVPSLTTATAL